MPAEEESTARVTSLMLYKELREAKELLIEMRADLGVQKSTLADHENRLRSLERFKWLLAGLLSVGGGSIGAALQAYLNK